MRNVRAAIMPLLVLALVVALSYYELKVGSIAKFDMIWDVLLGGAIGVALALLPSLSGFGAKRNALTGMYWVCGFTVLLLIFYQYMTSITGSQISGLYFLSNPAPRMCVAEGTVLGFCSMIAGRGKV